MLSTWRALEPMALAVYQDGVAYESSTTHPGRDAGTAFACVHVRARWSCPAVPAILDHGTHEDRYVRGDGQLHVISWCTCRAPPRCHCDGDSWWACRGSRMETRIVAFLLAGYTLLTALLFHHDFSDQNQMLNFLKNVSIAGGFLLVLANGAGPISLDARRTGDSTN